jgi:hypothetical protein
MFELNDDHIEFILADIKSRGITLENVQMNLLDHVCILMEQNLSAEEDFDSFYEQTIRRFYRNELKEIEEEAVFLASHRRPYWILGRNQFFLMLFAVIIGPFIYYDLHWLLHSDQQLRWHIPLWVWGPSLVYSVFPLLVVLVLYLTPNRLDPLIPWKSKILLGLGPWIEILPPSTSGSKGNPQNPPQSLTVC